MSVADIERLLAEHRQETRAQLQGALKAMHVSAVRLLRQVAAEVWRGTAPGGDDRLRDGILRSLARDDALRALLAQVDERHQGLALRIDRIEGALRRLVAANREAVKAAGGGPRPATVERIDGLEGAVREAIAEERQELRTVASALRQAQEAQARSLAGVRSAVDRALGDQGPGAEAVRSAVQELRKEQAGAAEAVRSAVQELRNERSRDAAALRSAFERAGEAQRQQTGAVAARLAEGLAEVSAKLDEALAQISAAERHGVAPGDATLETSIARAVERSLQRHADRQEQLLDRGLARLQAAIDGLGPVVDVAPPPPARPGTAERLRSLERRLSRVSGELAALEPIPQGSGA